MFGHYFKVALRNLLRHKGYSAINILGLAVGMACCIAILLLVRHELSFDRFHDKADRIYRLGVKAKFGEQSTNFGIVMGAAAPAILQNFSEATAFTRLMRIDLLGQGVSSTRFLVHYMDKNLFIDNTFFADPGIFEMFDFEIIDGDKTTALQAPFSAVVSEDMAQNIFGSENPIGQTIQSNEGKSYQITGVFKNTPLNSHLQFDMLFSTAEFMNNEHHRIHSWENFDCWTYLLLEKNVSPKEFEEKLAAFVKQALGPMAESTGMVFFLQPLTDIHLHSSDISYGLDQQRSDYKYVRIYLGIASIVLLIACINFMSLSTARAAGRSREVGVRKVAGARRGQLVRQFIGESMLTAFLALLFAVALVELSLPGLNSFFATSLSLNLMADGTTILAFSGIVVLVGLLAGSYPAFLISAFRPIDSLHSSANNIGSKTSLRKILVAAQFVLSTVLIACSLLIGRQQDYLRKKDLGFNKEQVVVVPMNDEQVRKAFGTIRQGLMQNPAIRGITASSNRMAGIDFIMQSELKAEGNQQDSRQFIEFITVDYNFSSFFEIELAEGRFFSREFQLDASLGGSYIINQTLASQLGWDKAIGKNISLGGIGNDRSFMGTVIGVVKDFHFKSLHHPIGPLALVLYPEMSRLMFVRIRPESMKETLAFIESKWAEYAPGVPFEYSFLDDDFALTYETEQKMGVIVRIFTLLAIFVACLGLLGLISFAAERRTKEIGIRKVLGASVSQIVFLLSKEFLLLLGIAVVIAWPVAWYAMDRWLQNFAYRIELDVWTFLLAGLLALVIAAGTVSFQAVKAATANPVDALRYE